MCIGLNRAQIDSSLSSASGTEQGPSPQQGRHDLPWAAYHIGAGQMLRKKETHELVKSIHQRRTNTV